jgi:hypothetical protein
VGVEKLARGEAKTTKVSSRQLTEERDPDNEDGK